MDGITKSRGCFQYGLWFAHKVGSLWLSLLYLIPQAGKYKVMPKLEIKLATYLSLKTKD